MSGRVDRSNPAILNEADEVPLQYFLMRGKELVVADTLSRAPLPGLKPEDLELEQETTAFVCRIIQGLPATEKRLQEITNHQQEDDMCLSR